MRTELGLLLILALPALGCEDGVRRIDAPACDPLLDTGCPPQTHCRLVGGGAVSCLARRARPADGGCVPGSCPPGQACVELEGALDCRTVCAVEDDQCPTPSRCAYRLDPQSPLGLCSPACDLADSCPVGQACTTTARLDHLVCGASGDGLEGDACGANARCGLDMACLVDVDGTPRCRALCSPDADDCTAGACLGRIRQVPEVGFCTGV